MPLGHYHRVRLLLLLASLAAVGVFAWAGATFDVPAFPERSPSLLGQPWPFVAVAITLVAAVASVLLGTLLAGTVRFDAGLVAAGIGLGTLAVRGGPMRYAIMHADGPGVFLRLAVELAIQLVQADDQPYRVRGAPYNTDNGVRPPWHLQHGDV